MEYHPHKIEQKWQQYWEQHQTYKSDLHATDKQKFFILDMLPYPSSHGLHMGHVESYTISDVVARHKRMMGYNVLHPQAFDSFGLPAENYAVQTGIHPAETTKQAGANYIRQWKSLGCAYDYDNIFYTSDPEYYRWTQWLFVQLYNNDLVYRKTDTVNWCESCKTVIANEQVVDGLCERCKNIIIQKETPTWSFATTQFADQLIDDLDTVDWPEHTKKNQINWIGKSQGAIIDFAIAESDESIAVFTTRPDTLFGVTYMVLAPEHPLVASLLNQGITNTAEVEQYIATTAKKTELARLENKEKTGVQLQGVFAVNPASGAQIPVFIADYVLARYGTGAIMAVPAHDQRDHEFAHKFGLSVVPVIQADTIQEESVYTGMGQLIDSGQFSGMSSADAQIAIVDHVGGQMTSTYRLKDWSISRQRYWGCPIPIVYDPQGQAHPIPAEHLPWTLPSDVDFVPKGTAPLADSVELRERTERIFGAGWRPETDTMDTFVCSSWYFLRYADPSNSQAWADKSLIDHWQPVDLYVGGAEHTYLHLLYARFWIKAMHKIGLIDFNEPFARLRHQGYVFDDQGVKMSKSLGNVVSPDEMVERFGADAVRLYVMFAGPIADNLIWNENGIVGTYRFIEKFCRQVEKLVDNPVDETESLVHKTIAKVSVDVEQLRFNTAISAMMVCINAMDKAQQVNRSDFQALVQMLFVFAPHIGQELFEQSGGVGMVDDTVWPVYDANLTQEQSVTLAVQVGGKMRGTIDIATDATESVAVEMAQGEESIAKWISGDITKVIYVPGKILNIIVQ